MDSQFLDHGTARWLCISSSEVAGLGWLSAGGFSVRSMAHGGGGGGGGGFERVAHV